MNRNWGFGLAWMWWLSLKQEARNSIKSMLLPVCGWETLDCGRMCVEYEYGQIAGEVGGLPYCHERKFTGEGYEYAIRSPRQVGFNRRRQ